MYENLINDEKQRVKKTDNQGRVANNFLYLRFDDEKSCPWKTVRKSNDCHDYPIKNSWTYMSKKGILPNPIQEFFAWLGKKSCQLLVDS